MFSKTTVRLAAASGVFVGLAVGMPLGAAISHADTPHLGSGAAPGPAIEEDSPAWSCVDDGNRICGPGNAQGAPAGCYDDGGVLVAPWPCHVVVNPATGEGDVYLGLDPRILYP